ncbi:hypothetical protein K2173_016920 [Erythroxylum novogranatense]|uniref:50S ribosomal protein L19, chloroplastic n=1 Tax=Erythroxylum novogranatense TaxID=1862640 RepID=A0AAV8U8H3_9ROSI|nr:hypothetical protein K2173_016920 [Erythroxylum novogranatense]
MGSKILPQALVVIPRTPVQLPPPRRLGFSCNVKRACGLSSGSPFSRVGSSSMQGINAVFSRLSFVARAEESVSGGGETVVDNENVGEEGAPVDVVEEGEEIKADEIVKEPRKPRVKLGEIMGILNKRAVEASQKERPTPDIRTGDIVEIKLEVPENRRRLSVYKGIVMSKQNAGIHTTIRIRRVIAGIGVEIVFPVYSPNIKEIKVVNHRKVRRARLYYLRDKLPRLSTFK